MYCIIEKKGTEICSRIITRWYYNDSSHHHHQYHHHHIPLFSVSPQSGPNYLNSSSPESWQCSAKHSGRKPGTIESQVPGGGDWERKEIKNKLKARKTVATAAIAATAVAVAVTVAEAETVAVAVAVAAVAATAAILAAFAFHLSRHCGADRAQQNDHTRNSAWSRTAEFVIVAHFRNTELKSLY
ncbi:hypothetical protein V1477_002331 [Vespula maculifrons]|uniref:Uncharacterized protein n=1 Tax=Vespula maculifrons TaxID=7453 RepID=A0ABD2CW98_VESMC